MTDKPNPDQLELTVEAAGHDPDRIEVEPEVLVWARKSIGLDVERAAKKIGVVQKTLEKWESGDASPSLAQLRKVAQHRTQT